MCSEKKKIKKDIDIKVFNMIKNKNEDKIMTKNINLNIKIIVRAK